MPSSQRPTQVRRSPSHHAPRQRRRRRLQQPRAAATVSRGAALSRGGNLPVPCSNSLTLAAAAAAATAAGCSLRRGGKGQLCDIRILTLAAAAAAATAAGCGGSPSSVDSCRTAMTGGSAEGLSAGSGGNGGADSAPDGPGCFCAAAKLESVKHHVCLCRCGRVSRTLQTSEQSTQARCGVPQSAAIAVDSHARALSLQTCIAAVSTNKSALANKQANSKSPAGGPRDRASARAAMRRQGALTAAPPPARP